MGPQEQRPASPGLIRVGTWGPSGGPEDRAEAARVGMGKRLLLPDPGPVDLALIKKVSAADRRLNDLEKIDSLSKMSGKGFGRLRGAASIASSKINSHCSKQFKMAQDLAVIRDWIFELQDWELPPTDETSPARTVLEVYDTLGGSIVNDVSLGMVSTDPMQTKAALDTALNHPFAPIWRVDPRVARWRKDTKSLTHTINAEAARTEEARRIVEESWPGDCIEQNLVFQSAYGLSNDLRMCLQFISLIEIALDRYEKGPIGPQTCLRVIQMLGRVKEQARAIEKLRAEEADQVTDTQGGAGGSWLI